MKNGSPEVRAVATTVQLAEAVALTFPATIAANDLTGVRQRPPVHQQTKISQAHFDQMRAPGSDCF